MYILPYLRCRVRVTHDMQSFPINPLLAAGVWLLRFTHQPSLTSGNRPPSTIAPMQSGWRLAHSWGQPGSGSCNIGERWWNACRHVVNERFGQTCARFLHRDNPSRPQTMYFWCPLSNAIQNDTRWKTVENSTRCEVGSAAGFLPWQLATCASRNSQGPRGTTHAAFLRPASSEENLLLFSHQFVERKHGMETPKVAISCNFSVQPISWVLASCHHYFLWTVPMHDWKPFV